MTTKHPDLEARALAAYYRYASRHGVTDQPAPSLTEVRELDGQPMCVVLCNVRGPLATYRVREGGALMRL